MNSYMRHASLGAVALLGIASAAAGCSGSNNSGSLDAPPPVFGPGNSLVNTCGQICANVLSECGVGSELYPECNDACNDLILVPQLCLEEFASYLTCLTGATSINCTANTITIAQASCAEQQSAYVTCNGGPSPVAACIQLPSSNTSCGPASGSEGLPSAVSPEFCVGQPDGCTPSGNVPLQIGTYCCTN